MESNIFALILGVLGTMAFFFFRRNTNNSNTERELGKQEGIRETLEKAQADLLAGLERVKQERAAKEAQAKTATTSQVEDFYEKNLTNNSGTNSSSSNS